jgi:hypothetical protein
LKIIKAEKGENDSQQATVPRAKGKSEMKMLKVLEMEKAPKNKIYSQVISMEKSILHFI